MGKPHGPSTISGDADPKYISTKKLEAVTNFMKQTIWEHEGVVNWISSLNPDFYQEAHKCYQGHGEETLQHLYQGPRACHLGFNILENAASGPHRDDKDVPEALTGTHTWGKGPAGKWRATAMKANTGRYHFLSIEDAKPLLKRVKDAQRAGNAQPNPQAGVNGQPAVNAQQSVVTGQDGTAREAAATEQEARSKKPQPHSKPSSRLVLLIPLR
ncbi:MAG: hypothetical protein Q9166_005751 [cf. Caloplaca sp. 2 TL-2023]